MKIIFYLMSICSFALCANIYASDDPVKDFLSQPTPWMRGPGFYNSDQIFCLELDLQGNGNVETLITLNRDRDGQQGNIWAVYKKTSTGFQSIGSITFSRYNYYLGKIDQLNSYGLVTIGSGGGGRGSITAYIDEGDSIKTTVISDVTPFNVLTKEGSKFEGYFNNRVGQNGVTGLAKGITVIPAEVLANKYGIHIENESFMDAVKSKFKGIPSN